MWAAERSPAPRPLGAAPGGATRRVEAVDLSERLRELRRHPEAWAYFDRSVAALCDVVKTWSRAVLSACVFQYVAQH